jgi:hypothetical protein
MASKYIILPDATKDLVLDTIGDAADAAASAGKMNFYDVDDVLLGTLTLADPAYGASVAGVKTLDTIPAAVPAIADGTASYFTVTDGDDTLVFTASCGVTGSGEACELNTLEFITGIDNFVTLHTLTLE